MGVPVWDVWNDVVVVVVEVVHLDASMARPKWRNWQSIDDAKHAVPTAEIQSKDWCT